jgi:hypothetical protein
MHGQYLAAGVGQDHKIAVGRVQRVLGRICEGNGIVVGKIGRSGEQVCLPAHYDAALMLKNFENHQGILGARGQFLPRALLDGLADDKERNPGETGDYQHHGQEKLGAQPEIGQHFGRFCPEGCAGPQYTWIAPHRHKNAIT